MSAESPRPANGFMLGRGFWFAVGGVGAAEGVVVDPTGTVDGAGVDVPPADDLDG